MPCEWFKFNGGVAHIRHGNKHALFCEFCHQRPTTKLCDFPENGRTCDRAMCSECATNVGKNRDYCPEHKKFVEQFALPWER